MLSAVSNHTLYTFKILSAEVNFWHLLWEWNSLLTLHIQLHSPFLTCQTICHCGKLFFLFEVMTYLLSYCLIY